MATKIIKTIFQFRRATAAEWEANKTVIPAVGEPCFVIDKNILKIGDGKTTFENLEPINGAKVEIAADGKSVVLEDNVFKLMGFDAAEAGAQPRKAADGTIEWVVPSTETVEGLQTSVAGLQSDVTALQKIVGTTEAGTDSLANRVSTVEDAISTLNGDVTVEGSVKKTVADEINAFATAITDDGVVNSYKELIDYVVEHGSEAATMAGDIATLQGLVGNKSVEEQIAAAGHMAEDKAMAIFEQVKYEVTDTPVGTLVDYRDKEIRIMVPSDAQFKLQSVGAGGDANNYYMTFKTYAPNNAVGYIEHLGDQVDAEILTDLKTDKYGRKYQPTWLAIARYDEATDTWTYYGKNSSVDKYIGWDYQIDWYDANGVVIASDKIRINLSNEACHNNVKPFYMAEIANKIESVKVGETVLGIVDKQVVIPVGAGLKGSDEVEIAEDGSIRIKALSWDKLIAGEDSIVMDGGGAA